MFCSTYDKEIYRCLVISQEILISKIKLVVKDEHGETF